MQKSEEIFEESTSRLSDDLDKIMDLPDSKNLTKDEEKNVLSNIVSFAHTLKKTSKNGMVSPELKEINRCFSKSNYDISKMPKEYAQSLKRTYDDFSEVIKENPGYYKGKMPKVYCDTYELFNGTKFKNFVNKFKNSKSVKKIAHSGESLCPDNLIESYERYVADICYGMDDNERSEEFLGGIINPIITSFGSLTGSVTTLSSIVIISIVVISILIICLCICSSIYQQRVCEAIEELCRNSIQNEYSYALNKKDIVESMENSIPKGTNTFLIKPMAVTSKFLNKITEPKHAKQFEKNIEFLDKNDSKSKEDLEQSQEVGALGITAMAAGGAVVGHVTPVVIAVSIIIGLILIIPLTRGLIYWCSRFKFKVGSLLKEQNELINCNVEVLIKKLNDPNIADDEKERLKRVISRQEGIAKTIGKLSNVFYKEQINANMESKYEIADDDKTDYDQVVEDMSKNATTDSEETPNEATNVVINKSEIPSTGQASILW